MDPYLIDSFSDDTTTSAAADLIIQPQPVDLPTARAANSDNVIPASPKKLNDVFEYAESTARCLICQVTVNRAGRNTSGMWQHLKIAHPTLHDILKKPKDIAPKQPKLIQEFYPLGSSRHQFLNKFVINFVCAGLHPFSIVDEPHFRSLINAIDPKYKLPSRKTVSDNLLDIRYNEVIANFKNILQKLPENHQIAITTDGWSSNDKNKSKYNSLTCQFFDSSRIRSFTLGIKGSTFSQNSQNILSEIQAMLAPYDLESKKFEYFLITDTAAPMKKLMKLVINLFIMYIF